MHDYHTVNCFMLIYTTRENLQGLFCLLRSTMHFYYKLLSICNKREHEKERQHIFIFIYDIYIQLFGK